MKQLALLLLCACGALSASAQDKIYTQLQKAPIEGTVTEVGDREISYQPKGRPLPVLKIDKQDVIRIVYENGDVTTIRNPLTDFGYYPGQHRWIGKVHLLSPLFGYTGLALEHAQKPGRSVEYKLHLIGLGIDNYAPGQPDAPRGAGAGIGIRFYRLPDYVDGQARFRHIMQGAYIKPGIMVSLYNRGFTAHSTTGTYVNVNKLCYSVNPQVTFGRQFIFDNTFSFEFYFSAGISFDNIRENERKVQNDFGNYGYFNYNSLDFDAFNGVGTLRTGDHATALTIGTGITFGYLFDFRKPRTAQ